MAPGLKLPKRFSDLGIKYKLLASYLLLITVPLCLFLFINTYVTSRETEKQALYSARRVLNQTKSYLDFKAESIRNSLNFIAVNDTILEMMEQPPERYRNNIGLWGVDSNKIVRLLYAARGNDIVNIHLYMKQGLASVFENEDFMDLKKEQYSKWYQTLIANNDVIRWFPGKYFPKRQKEACLYLVRNIVHRQNINDIIGVVKGDVPEKVFRTILNEAVFTKSTSAILINSYGEIICASSHNHYQDPQVLQDILARLNASQTNGGLMDAPVWKTLTVSGDRILAGAGNIDKTDWTFLLIIPYKDILDLSVTARRQMIVIFLIIAPLTLPLAFWVAASATKRIKKLAAQMKRIENGDFNAEIPPENQDEIGELTRNFNYMLKKIDTLMNEKYLLGQEIKNLELKALQAQINPHFLYNSLDLINWMAIRANVPQIRRVVEALSNFYRLSVSKGEDVVTLKNELDHIKSYVDIQNLRFDNNIHLLIDVPESLHEYLTLKLILQPIVENAILHGILEKETGAGIIQVSANLDDNILTIWVADDGVGMTEEMAAQILTHTSSDEYHGYGVKNVNERIKLNFGDTYGLSYSSRPGQGTVATIKIPARKRSGSP
ncbi:MAG: sensor histidine kinase [Firmicutes bacterium]|nr:sensor histidine kinase [Bacillota bacterium]